VSEGDFPDVEGGMRKFLRDDTGVSTLVGNRVFFGVPKSGAQFPLITVRRTGGSDDISEAPIDLAVMSISCWGSTTKQQAWDVTAAVRRALHSIREKTQTLPSVYVHGASVDGVIWSPDPEDDRPRYIVTARVTATAA
jgi:hypothetical protein